MRPDIAQAIHDAAVSKQAGFLDLVADKMLSDAFMRITEWAVVARCDEDGFDGWLRTDEGRTYMLLVAEALS
jgi:hypothetical protein